MSANGLNVTDPTAAEVRTALDRVLRSRAFEHADRASNFLRFVATETLAGRSERLKGYTIAVQVFGRPVDFDAQTDPLVRVEAVRLRQRLVEYYAGEGRADPVRLALPRGGYAVVAAYTQPPEALPGRRSSPRLAALLDKGRRWPWLAAAAAIAAATIAFALLYREPTIAPSLAAVPPERAHKTRIIVVPLENLSADPRLHRLAASLTEEILLRLGELDLFVIATQATWYGSGSPLDGVLGTEHSYVLTGSVRDSREGPRVTLRIIAAETGNQIWSAAFDEPPDLERQPAEQVDIARAVAAAAAPFGPVFQAELALARRAAHTPELPDCQIRYREFRRVTDPAQFPDALACYQSLVERQPTLAYAWAGLAMLFVDEHTFHASVDGESESLEKARAAVGTAMELDSDNVMANAALTRVQYYSGDDAFLHTAQRTLALDPNNPEMLGLFGITLTAYGDVTHGLELVAQAERLAAQPRPVFNLAYVFAHLQDGNPCAAVPLAQELDMPRWFVTHMVTAAAAGLCGDKAAAAEARLKLLALSPDIERDLPGLVEVWRFDPRLHDAMLRGLREAGFLLDVTVTPNTGA
jgi:adenylate cyclase